MVDSTAISASGLRAQSVRLSTSASNIANLTTSGRIPDADNPNSSVYNPKDAVLDTVSIGAQGAGVRASVVGRENGTSIAYDPQSSFSNQDGFIAVPNISLEREIVDVKIAEIAYKANVQALKVADELNRELLDTLA